MLARDIHISSSDMLKRLPRKKQNGNQSPSCFNTVFRCELMDGVTTSRGCFQRKLVEAVRRGTK